MADKKISALTGAATPLAGTEVLPIVQSGATVKVSISDVTAGRQVALSSAVAGTGLTAIPWVLNANSSFYQAGNISSVIGTSGIVGVGTELVRNAYYDGSWKYAGSGSASRLVQTGGQLINYRAVSGTANAAVTWIQNLTVDASDNATVNLGNLVVGTAGKGIDFSANGGDVLKQYDEGTYTPVFTASSSNPTVTYSRQRGKYVRIGNIVTISVDLIWSAISGGSGDVQLSLPFAGESSVGASGAGPIAVLDGVTFAASRTFCNVQPQASVLYATLPQAGSGVSTSNTTVAQLSASGRLVLSCTYLV